MADLVLYHLEPPEFVAAFNLYEDTWTSKTDKDRM